MKSIQLLALSSILAVSTHAFAADNDTIVIDSIDSKTEVAYTCNILVNQKIQDQKITAMYGIKDGEVVMAQLKINNEITPAMGRTADAFVNRFISKDGTMWTTLPAKADNIRQVDGGILSTRINNENRIVVNKCKLDKAATAKLK